MNSVPVLETISACDCSFLYSSMNEVVHTSPTIGSNVEEIVVNNTHLLMWDIGGQESLRSSWNTYYTNTEVCVCAHVDRGEWWGSACVALL